MKTCKIGRGADNDIVCTHGKVSTSHADLIVDNGVFTLIDHSKNGTLVNQARIHNTSCSVNPGDSIVFAGEEMLDWEMVARIFHMTLPSSYGRTRRITSTLREKQGRITIGRDLQNDIVYDSQEISSSHAEIIDREDSYTLIDHSKNGTFVNGHRIHNESCTVNYGDSIVFAGVEELNWRKVARLLNKTITIGSTHRVHATGTIQIEPKSIPKDSVPDYVNKIDTDSNHSYGVLVLLLGLVALGIDVYLFIDFYTSTFIRLVKFTGASGIAWFPAYLNGYGIVNGKWMFMIASLVLGIVADFIANVMDEKDDKLTSAGLGLANTAISISVIFLLLAIFAPYIYSNIQ